METHPNGLITRSSSVMAEVLSDLAFEKDSILGIMLKPVVIMYYFQKSRESQLIIHECL